MGIGRLWSVYRAFRYCSDPARTFLVKKEVECVGSVRTEKRSAFGGASSPVLSYGATDYAPQLVNYFSAIVVEAIGTFFLLFVIMATALDKRAPAGWSGFAIGLTLALSILVTGVVTGGNFNPARAFGPTIVQMLFGNGYPFGHLFIYFIGPIIGGVLGAFAYEYLARPHAAEETYRPPEPSY